MRAGPVCPGIPTLVLSILAAAGPFARPAPGEVFPALETVGENFRFVINADAHVTRERANSKARAPHNQMLREFVKEVNAMPDAPAFVVFNGDIYERDGAPETTDILLGIVKDLKPLAIAVTGNHDVRDFDVDRIFRPVQKAMNGTTEHTFSFDCGAWHFVVLPTRELLLSPEREKACLDWLDRDLAANRGRPTMAFSHYHVLPVGTSQLEFYTYPMHYKNALLETLARHGNVRYVFSGHVHAGIQSSVKTAWRYRGIDFVIAPSPVRPRPFGEEYPAFTSDGGYYSVVEVRGTEARIVGRQIGNKAEHAYPTRFREFDPAIDPRCLTAAWDLPAGDRLANGGFEDGLRGWHAPYRYLTETEPGYEWASSAAKKASGERAARLMVREKGQGWALGEFTELYQVVKAAPAAGAMLRLRYLPEEAVNGGGYVWLGGFKGRQAQCVLAWQWGPKMEARHTLHRVIGYVMTAGEHAAPGIDAMARQKRALYWPLPAEAGRWHEVRIDLAAAMDKATGRTGSLQAMEIDRVMIGVGAWCGDAPGSRSVAWFDDMDVRFGGGDGVMTVDGAPFDAANEGRDRIIEAERPKGKSGSASKPAGP